MSEVKGEGEKNPEKKKKISQAVKKIHKRIKLKGVNNYLT